MIGIFFGFFATSLNAITLWITASLYGGYTAANVLKWVWWRFNGYGYFWGMLTGLLASTVKLIFFGDWVDIYFFPIIFALSLVGCLLGSYLNSPDNIDVLKSFYKNVRPWCFWNPVLLEVQKDMVVRQLIEFPDLYYTKSHFPLEISQRAFDHLWRMCESYELWCKETNQTELLFLNIID